MWRRNFDGVGLVRRPQTYIEDCEVCCKPIEIGFTVENDELASFYAKTLD
jgi:cysteine-rich CPXCG protein